jgi:hypothetical protein
MGNVRKSFKFAARVAVIGINFTKHGKNYYQFYFSTKGTDWFFPIRITAKIKFSIHLLKTISDEVQCVGQGGSKDACILICRRHIALCLENLVPIGQEGK